MTKIVAPESKAEALADIKSKIERFEELRAQVEGTAAASESKRETIASLSSSIGVLEYYAERLSGTYSPSMVYGDAVLRLPISNEDIT